MQILQFYPTLGNHWIICTEHNQFIPTGDYIKNKSEVGMIGNGRCFSSPSKRGWLLGLIGSRNRRSWKMVITIAIIKINLMLTVCPSQF